MPHYDRLADLPLTIDGIASTSQDRLERGDFERVTTTLTLTGDDTTGQGEDVIYDVDLQDHFQATIQDLPLQGTYTIDSFSSHLDTLDLFQGEPPERADYYNYRQWTLESAALDLALRQQGTSLASRIGMEYSPVRFIASPRDTGSIDAITGYMENTPGIELKLDATAEWDGSTIRQLADFPVQVIDMKGHYSDPDLRGPADPALYRAIVQHLDTVIEDPVINDETRPILEQAADRISWDKPITSRKDIQQREWEPSWVNIKPSRFGSIETLLDTIEYCSEKEINMYGGGQFELGIGREHIHTLASLFYPDGPNDVAPRQYNREELPEDLPSSPLQPASTQGLGWTFR